MHNTKIIAVKQINNEQVAYTIQCCADPMEISSHTFSILVPDHATLLEAIKAEVAARHESMVAWRKANAVRES